MAGAKEISERWQVWVKVEVLLGSHVVIDVRGSQVQNRHFQFDLLSDGKAASRLQQSKLIDLAMVLISPLSTRRSNAG